MSIFLPIAVLVVMIIGLVGVITPLLPGIPLIFLAYGIYGFLTDWQNVSILSVVVMGLVATISFVIDYVAAAMGAKRYGASKAGIWGAILGALLGVVVFNFFGLIIGPIIGAFIGEIIDGKPHPLAAKASWGTLVGLLAGSFIKVIIGVTMIATFIWQISS